MTDRTTAGIEAEPEEVEAMLHNLCGFHLAERDPVARYAVLTREQVLYEALAAAIRRERGRALAELAARGHKLTEVAELTGLGTRQRVQRLIQVSTAVEQNSSTQAVTEAQEASRQFEERLAAVEATLDEVVSGVPTVNEAAAPVADDYDLLMAKEPYVVETFGSGAYTTVPAAYEEPSYDEPAFDQTALGEPTFERRAFDPLTADIDELASMLEPTRVMPALSGRGADGNRTRTVSLED